MYTLWCRSCSLHAYCRQASRLQRIPCKVYTVFNGGLLGQRRLQNYYIPSKTHPTWSLLYTRDLMYTQPYGFSCIQLLVTGVHLQEHFMNAYMSFLCIYTYAVIQSSPTQIEFSTVHLISSATRVFLNY